MSIRARRQSLLKSSISIKSIRDSVAAFNKGLQQAKKNAAEIVKNTKIEIAPNSYNLKYLETKRDKMGHDILKK